MLFLTAPARILALPFRRVGRLSLFQTLLKLDGAYRQRQRLTGLDDCRLKDMGLDRAGRNGVTRRARWDGPDYWRR